MIHDLDDTLRGILGGSAESFSSDSFDREDPSMKNPATWIELPAGITLGSVPYLNARPLHFALVSQIELLPPRRLAAEMQAGCIAVGLVPLVEVLENPSEYDIVDGIAIGSLRQVYSVILTHSVPLEKICTVALDPDSKSSVNLARVLLETFHGLKPHYVLPNMIHHGIQARVIIGDPAITFRQKNPAAPVLDLAEEWNRFTGLPVVFAVWAIRQDTPGKQAIAEKLRQAACLGLAARRKMAQTDFEYRYLTENLFYGLEEAQKQAITRFGEELLALQLISKRPEITYI